MKEIFTIGEVSKLFQINIRTLRYYDEIGLLKPEYTDSDTKYRYYSTKQFERLNTIKYLRALDVSLAQIISFFEKKDVEHMLKILEEQKKEMERKKEELKLIEKKINCRLSQLNYALNTEIDKIEIKMLKERKIVLLKKEISIEEDLETSIRALENLGELNASVFLGKIGLSLDKNKILEGDISSFSSIFIIIESSDKYKGQKEVLSGGSYVILRYRGSHKDSAAYYKKLMDYIELNGYFIAGDAIEITMIDSGLTDDEDRFVTEIQIPINTLDSLVTG